VRVDETRQHKRAGEIDRADPFIEVPDWTAEQFDSRRDVFSSPIPADAVPSSTPCTRLYQGG